MPVAIFRQDCSIEAALPWHCCGIALALHDYYPPDAGDYPTKADCIAKFMPFMTHTENCRLKVGDRVIVETEEGLALFTRSGTALVIAIDDVQGEEEPAVWMRYGPGPPPFHGMRMVRWRSEPLNHVRAASPEEIGYTPADPLAVPKAP